MRGAYIDFGVFKSLYRLGVRDFAGVHFVGPFYHFPSLFDLVACNFAGADFSDSRIDGEFINFVARTSRASLLRGAILSDQDVQRCIFKARESNIGFDFFGMRGPGKIALGRFNPILFNYCTSLNKHYASPTNPVNLFPDVLIYISGLLSPGARLFEGYLLPKNERDFLVLLSSIKPTKDPNFFPLLYFFCRSVVDRHARARIISNHLTAYLPKSFEIDPRFEETPACMSLRARLQASIQDGTILANHAALFHSLFAEASEALKALQNTPAAEIAVESRALSPI